MLHYRLLGPLEVVDDDGRRVDIGGRQPRILLAVLLVAGGRRVTVDALADAIWSGEPPASATGTVQSYVSRLRRRLGAE
ncbi:MAG TPA: winged helix-turn-helix domain-containing protein, partial [Acidimicrobiales bacterium]|nr:winged helix-turn-helix domain-containing protein [Acidimicrobiales bacterium]